MLVYMCGLITSIHHDVLHLKCMICTISCILVKDLGAQTSLESIYFCVYRISYLFLSCTLYFYIGLHTSRHDLLHRRPHDSRNWRLLARVKLYRCISRYYVFYFISEEERDFLSIYTPLYFIFLYEYWILYHHDLFVSHLKVTTSSVSLCKNMSGVCYFIARRKVSI